MTAHMTSEAWSAAAAALVVHLASIEEPIAWHHSIGPRRYCVLCSEEARTQLGPVPHSSDCLWKHAQWLMNEAVA